MRNGIRKCITCHAGSRDNYQLSIALHEASLLETLVTDFYTPQILNSFIRKRYNEKIPNIKTQSLYGNFIYSQVFKNSYQFTDKRLSLHSGRLALKKKSNLYLCSYTAFEAFQLIKENNLSNKCILFQLHPHLESLRLLYNEELLNVPQASYSLLNELEMTKNDYTRYRLTNESLLADHCVVASSFTKETLIKNGINDKNISIVPYGVDRNRFFPKNHYNKNSGSLKILFIGQMIQRKGLYYLLEAVRLLKTKNISLTIIGRGLIDHKLLSHYNDISSIIEIKKNISDSELLLQMHAHDVLVFPSIAEGFGHVILEAMSCGLPVITTYNTAANDLFLTGNEGIILPIRDISKLAESIDWCINNKDDLSEMGKIAADTSSNFTWEKFRNGIITSYYKFLNI